jgi:hypothetical protein
MKASIAIPASIAALLAIAAGYLGLELRAARAQADESARLAQHLTSRVIELERSRAMSAVPTGVEMHAAPGPSAAAGSAPLTTTSHADTTSLVEAIEQSTAARPHTPAMQRVQRIQSRANAKRVYADFAAEYGLSSEDAGRLYELMAEHEMEYPNGPPTTDPASFEAAWREHDRKFREKANALLGPDGADRLNRYQGTFGARDQVAQLEDQLATLDMPLSEEQRRRLTRAAIHDGEQFPLPAFSPGQDPEQLSQQYLAWERDRKERLAATARTILNAGQMRHFDDLRQSELDAAREQ